MFHLVCIHTGYQQTFAFLHGAMQVFMYWRSNPIPVRVVAV